MLEPGRRAPRPVPVRGARFGMFRRRLAGGLTILAILGVWEAATWFGAIDPQVLPGPMEIATTLVQLLRAGDLSLHLSASLPRLGLGWGIGAAAGVALGMALGLHTLLRAAGSMLVWLLASIPQVMLLPLFVVWFETPEQARITTIAAGVLFPAAISTAAAVDGIDRSLVRMAQSFNLPRWSIVWRVVVPAALPAILSGLGLSTSLAILLLVATEMINAPTGIGSFVLTAGHLEQTDRALAGIALISLFGFAVGAVFRSLGRLAARQLPPGA